MSFHSVKKRNIQLAKKNKKLRHYGMKLYAITTPKQHQFILQSVGCARFTFNFYLNGESVRRSSWNAVLDETGIL